MLLVGVVGALLALGWLRWEVLPFTAVNEICTQVTAHTSHTHTHITDDSVRSALEVSIDHTRDAECLVIHVRVRVFRVRDRASPGKAVLTMGVGERSSPGEIGDVVVCCVYVRTVRGKSPAQRRWMGPAVTESGRGRWSQLGNGTAMALRAVVMASGVGKGG